MAKRRGKRRRDRRDYLNHRERSADTREALQRILIVCEGEKTEPNYLGSFGGPTLVVDVRGFGISPRKLVDKALELGVQGDYEQIWCVFDRDDQSVGDFNGAIQRAESQGLRVAYSNQAFELWYLLHFHYYNTPMGRANYSDKLSELLPGPYQKNDQHVYALLLSKQSTAVGNAERLLNEYSPPNPGRDDPSTTVHLLVQELNLLHPDNR